MTTPIIFGPGPVIPSVSAFVQEGLTTLVQATTTDAFNSAFDAFFDKHVNVTLNGVKVSRDAYSQQLLADNSLEQSATIDFKGIVEVSDASVPGVENAAVVGVFYVATIDETLRVLGGPMQKTITSSLNVTVSNSTSLTSRRVVAVNQVLVTAAVPIVLPQPTSST